MTLKELFDLFYKHNEENNVKSQFDDENRLVGIIVFRKDNWKTEYSLESRSYLVASDNKFFIPEMNGRSIFSNSMDGSDRSVRLDDYLFGRNAWKVDYCYLMEDPK